ncbi:uncharacterized protein PHALS_05211 [Plasmopara halstedii]|uniref:Uncharacterized protein n=1 Tax=Plasmopara halstedii TaxID=4781 RepID=A0A0P1B133_PLAHL|nr:uncharacterized protein PHALS_05211 [Plasmopara halstedii]CEG47886.1 hypothetical protein PHALS_05211 [Plasmopara halstedii]|eukprot:XP_024584255.1 hypothetical protein PHALS_05211 [Plasmopara halstedii]
MRDPTCHTYILYKQDLSETIHFCVSFLLCSNEVKRKLQMLHQQSTVKLNKYMARMISDATTRKSEFFFI